MFFVHNDELHAVYPACNSSVTNSKYVSSQINFTPIKRRCSLNSLINKYDEELDKWFKLFPSIDKTLIINIFVKWFNNTYIKTDRKGNPVWKIK